MDKDQIESLLKTLSFLDAIGAGDAISETACDKSTLTLQTPKALAAHVLSQLETRSSSSPSEVVPPVESVKFTEPKTRPVNTDHMHSVHLKVQDLKKPPLGGSLQKHSDVVQQAQTLAASAATLDDLKTAMNSFTGCPLKITASHTVFADGNPNADLMLIGEAPGADEDRYGMPFVGRSGQLLDKMMAAIGMDRKTDYYISNIIPWRPPGNRPPTPEETEICLPFIQRHIQLKKPKYIICVGGTAAKALLNTKETMGKLRGKWFDYNAYSPQDDGYNTNSLRVPATVLFHPSYLLRSPGQKRLAWIDLQKIQKYFLQ